MDITINDISFRAKLGKNILKKVNKEFCGDKTRVEKYVQLFDDTFISNIDKETVVDINKNKNFVFSNNSFPDVKYQHYSKMKKTNSIAKALINECSKVFGGGEGSLFKIIICKYMNKGVEPQKLRQFADKVLTNAKSKESFLEKIKVAERIKKDYPDSKFSPDEFDYVQNVMMQEEAETPGTELYKLIHRLESSDSPFSFD